MPFAFDTDSRDSVKQSENDTDSANNRNDENVTPNKKAEDSVNQSAPEEFDPAMEALRSFSAEHYVLPGDWMYRKPPPGFETWFKWQRAKNEFVVRRKVAEEKKAIEKLHSQEVQTQGDEVPATQVQEAKENMNIENKKCCALRPGLCDKKERQVMQAAKEVEAKDKDEHDKKKEEHDINNNEGQAQKRKASGYPDTEAADIAKIARWIRTDGGREPDVL